MCIRDRTTVTAEFQTAGKGQRGNTWEAERGTNLLFSFVLYPTFLEARRDLERFFGKTIFLETFVKVDKDWRSSDKELIR